MASAKVIDALHYGEQLGVDAEVLTLVRTIEPSAMTLDEAVKQLVEIDVLKWGEAERDASFRLRKIKYSTLGLALNCLAYYDLDAPDKNLAAQALLAMTASDVRVLKRGG